MSQFTNSGLLLKNFRKNKPNHPDFTGEVTLICPCCHETFKRRLSAWKKTGRSGDFFSLSFSEEFRHPQTPSRSEPPETDVAAGSDDNVPY